MHCNYFMALRPNASHGLFILEISRSPTTTHHSRKDSSGRVISPSQRPQPDSTQHSLEADLNAPGVIRTRNPSKRSATNPLLKPHGHWDRHALWNVKSRKVCLAIRYDKRRESEEYNFCARLQLVLFKPCLSLQSTYVILPKQRNVIMAIKFTIIT